MEKMNFKLMISYFYMIRFFDTNIVPLSTAAWDPKWYHENQGHEHIFKHKDGVIYGLRIPKLVPLFASDDPVDCCPCENKDFESCNFLQNYYKQISKVNIDEIIKEMNDLAEKVRNMLKKNNDENKDKEIVICLIVYETPNNPCSERDSIIKYFSDNGIYIEEFEKLPFN